MNIVIKARPAERLSACARRSLRHTAAVTFLLAQIVTSAYSQTICSKPVQPLCSMEGGSAGSGPERLRCLEDVGRYIDGLDTYRACLDDVLANAEAIADAAARFRTCLREGRSDCALETDY